MVIKKKNTKRAEIDVKTGCKRTPGSNTDAKRNAGKQRERDSKVGHDGCRAEEGIQIALLHTASICMFPCRPWVSQGREKACGELRRAMSSGATR